MIRKLLSLFMDAARAKASTPHIPPRPVGHGKDYSWRASSGARRKSARSNRRKAARRRKGRG